MSHEIVLINNLFIICIPVSINFHNNKVLIKNIYCIEIIGFLKFIYTITFAISKKEKIQK
jgi:hypothetical protein